MSQASTLDPAVGQLASVEQQVQVAIEPRLLQNDDNRIFTLDST